MHGLTTAHGTVLCLDRAREQVVHRAIDAVDPADLVLIADHADPEAGLIEADGSWRPIDIGLHGLSRATVPPPPRLTIEDGLARLRYASGFLNASPDGFTRIDSPSAAEWETFGFVPRAALLDLIAASRDPWLRFGAPPAPGGEGEARRLALGAAGTVRIGELSYPIAGNFPSDPSDRAHARMVLFRDGWKVDLYRRYRPLVYFVLMGMGAYGEQLRLATASLVRHGGYRGDVLLITDRDDEVVAPLIDEALRPRLHVMRIAASDKVDAVLARLMLGEFPGAAEHAPILYSDTDIVFDRPLDPFLARAARAGRMSAQSEPWNRLPGAAHSGAELFAADPFEIEDPVGFNAGVLSMPGGPDSVRAIGIVRRAMSAYLGRHGRDSLPWLDQAMTNYVLRKLDHFDAGAVTATTRLAQQGYPLDPGAATGFVHFWPVSQRPDERADAMRHYLDALGSGGADASAARAPAADAPLDAGAP